MANNKTFCTLPRSTPENGFAWQIIVRFDANLVSSRREFFVQLSDFDNSLPKPKKSKAAAESAKIYEQQEAINLVGQFFLGNFIKDTTIALMELLKLENFAIGIAKTQAENQINDEVGDNLPDYIILSKETTLQ